jgi:DNA-binding NarL/FixJ family response regulator
MKPHLVLADDHALVLEALVCLLGDEFEVIATVADGGALVALAPHCQPDVILLDLTMPVLSGLEVLRLLVPKLPGTRFLVLTMHTDRGYVREAFAAGAHGYVVKGASPEELVAAVWTVVRGGRVVSPQLGADADALIHEPGPATRDGSGVLTARQREVLRRVAAGMPGKAIAAELGISLKTVEFHKTCISRQLGLKSTAALTRYAIAHGLAPPLAGDPGPLPGVGEDSAVLSVVDGFDVDGG